MSLPHSLLKQLWDAGYGGKVIRVPRMNERMAIKVSGDWILCEAEKVYETQGITFVFERKGRSEFYRSFGLLKLCRRLHIPMEEARKARRRAYWRWFRWLRAFEAERLSRVAEFGRNGEGKSTYLEIRGCIREGREVDGVSKVILQMARDSVEGVTWR